MGARARLRALRASCRRGSRGSGSSVRSAAAVCVRSALATGLGAASSSCSYAAIAIAKSMFAKGASLVSAMTFQFASTNLVFELGLVLWLFLGWRFTLAEFVGGIVLIALMWLALDRARLTRAERRRSRAHAAGSRHRPRAPRGGQRGAAAAAEAPLAAGVVGRRAQLPRRLGDVVEGDPGRLRDRRLRLDAAGERVQPALPDRRLDARCASSRTWSSARSSRRSRSSARSGTSRSRRCSGAAASRSPA